MNSVYISRTLQLMALFAIFVLLPAFAGNSQSRLATLSLQDGSEVSGPLTGSRLKFRTSTDSLPIAMDLTVSGEKIAGYNDNRLDLTGIGHVDGNFVSGEFIITTLGGEVRYAAADVDSIRLRGNEIVGDGGVNATSKLESVLEVRTPYTETDTISIGDRIVSYWPSKQGETMAEFQFDIKGYRNTYTLDCVNHRFLWTHNVRISTGEVTDNNNGAEWKQLNPESRITNAVYHAICPQLQAQEGETVPYNGPIGADIDGGLATDWMRLRYAGACAGPGVRASSIPCPYREDATCIGEGCFESSTTELMKPVILFANPGSKQSLYTAKAGDFLVHETSVTYSVPCRATVMSSFVPDLRPGKVVYRLSYAGEGTFRYLVDGRIVGSAVDDKILTAVECQQKDEEWIRLRTEGGIIGWAQLDYKAFLGTSIHDPLTTAPPTWAERASAKIGQTQQPAATTPTPSTAGVVPTQAIASPSAGAETRVGQMRPANDQPALTGVVRRSDGSISGKSQNKENYPRLIADAEQFPLSSVLKLKDGTLLIGKIKVSKVPFKSSFGTLDIDLGEVHAYGDKALLLGDGSVLKGSFEEGSVEITTSRGDLEIPAQDVVSIETSGGSKAALTASERNHSSKEIFPKEYLGHWDIVEDNLSRSFCFEDEQRTEPTFSSIFIEEDKIVYKVGIISADNTEKRKLFLYDTYSDLHSFEFIKTDGSEPEGDIPGMILTMNERSIAKGPVDPEISSDEHATWMIKQKIDIDKNFRGEYLILKTLSSAVEPDDFYKSHPPLEALKYLKTVGGAWYYRYSNRQLPDGTIVKENNVKYLRGFNNPVKADGCGWDAYGGVKCYDIEETKKRAHSSGNERTFRRCTNQNIKQFNKR